jgi:hypothetical protein
VFAKHSATQEQKYTDLFFCAIATNGRCSITEAKQYVAVVRNHFQKKLLFVPIVVQIGLQSLVN